MPTLNSSKIGEAILPADRPTGQIHALIFDFGGVLVDWNPRHLYRKLFQDPEEMECFLEEIDFNGWNMEQDRRRSFGEGVAALAERFPARADLIRAYHERWEESITGAIQGTLEIVQELRDAGYELYGLTNSSAEKLAQVRGRFPFLNWFDPLVISGEEGVCKPNAEIFERLLQRTGRSADECLFVDDSLANVVAAERLGFQAVHFRSPEQLREELVRRRILPP